MPPRMQTSPFAEALQESMSKITELGTQTQTRVLAHTWNWESKNLVRYIFEGAQGKAGKRRYGEIRSAQDVGMLQ